MADIIKPGKLQPAQREGVYKRPKPSQAAKHLKWSASKTRTPFMPLVTGLMRALETAPVLKVRSCIREAGVLAFRRKTGDATRTLPISKRRTGNWGICKGRVSSHLSVAETAVKEASEEAGVVGSISSGAVGMCRATKCIAGSLSQRVIEVWAYLLEVTEILHDWPEKGKRAKRWVTFVAAWQLREPVLAKLCHRLAQSSFSWLRASANISNR